MKTTQANFNDFAYDAEEYVRELAKAINQPGENKRVLILWRAVMHTIRDRIHFGEALDIVDPLPMIFKGIFVENWKFSEKPPLDFKTMKEMEREVEKNQQDQGEIDFDWNFSTKELIGIVLKSLTKFLPKQQMEHILGQLPKEVQENLKSRIQ